MRKYSIHFRGISGEAKDHSFGPLKLEAYSFLEAVVRAVAQVEYTEPGNFEVTMVKEDKNK